ncbi:hypothetical protein [Burkholderia ubonensis]|uniref:hypothetical protein n=1 Tax=Burkholderia ubonensis TaxID=101571 RepID=UPI000AE4B58E|nr:hypothetical protein [Burkholderia ubonensis]
MAIIKSIHTLNARGNVMLEVMRDYFKMTPNHMFMEIQRMRQSIEEALAKKKIIYDNLKSALVPSQNRRDIALIFDTTKIDSSWYGADVMGRVIPLFEEKSNHSVLLGDYLDRPNQMERLFEAFAETVEPRRLIEFRHPTQFFVVYVNNLTDAMVKRLDEGLACYSAYAGIADMTYGSVFKTYLSTMLVNSFIKHGRIIIQGHEPDRDPREDVNMNGYQFEENGYACRSVCGDLMGVMLSYKIERAVYPGFEVDTEFALNSIGLAPADLNEFEIEIAAEKLEYLKSEKSGSVARAGLEETTIEALSELIREKISASYIYNLTFLEQHNVAKFNIIIELPGREGRPATRLLAALACEQSRKVLRLLTLF